MAAPHVRDCVAPQQLPLACEHQVEADAPHAAAHQVQADQAGQQEVDIAGALVADTVLVDFQRVAAAGGALEHVFGDGARQEALFLGGVELEDERCA